MMVTDLLTIFNFGSDFEPVVNILKGKLWSDKSEFDEDKDKTTFRDYESACDRVKDFYREQHGERNIPLSGPQKLY